MAHDGGVTDRTPWERLDAPAATPASVSDRASTSSSGAARSTGRRRLARSRSPVVESFDRGGDVFQRRLRLVLVGSACLLGPLVALNLWVLVVGFDRFDPDDALFPSLGSGARSGIEDLAPFLGATAVSIATAVVGCFVAMIVLTDRFDGHAASAGLGLWSLLGRTIRRLPAVLVAWALGHWWQPLAALMVLSVDGEDAGGLLFMLGAGAWFVSALTLFVVPAMIAERLRPLAALRRSLQLSRRAYGTALLFVLTATAIGALYLLGVATIAPLLEANGFVDFGGAAWIVQGILVQLGVLLVVPLVAACTAQCYVEVRLAREGLDVVLDADAAFEAGVADASGDPIRDGAPT